MKQQYHQTDVVIIGGGISGIVTALELLKAGKRVTLVERDKEENFGGLAPTAFGGMALIGTPLQRKKGITDTPELALKDWHSFAEFSEDDVWPKRWAECYVNRSLPDVHDWLKEKGITFMPAVNWVERGLFTPGNSVPRYHVIWGTSKRLMDVLKAELTQYADKLTVLFEHHVTQLDKDGERIVGCSGTHQGADFAINADATVVATGGITGNIQKIKDNWYKPWGRPPETILNGTHPYSDGKMHDEVETHGGAVTHLDKVWNYAAGIPHPQPRFDGHGLSLIPCKSALWLDYSGKRIGPDPLVTGFDTHYLCKRTAEQPKSYTWQLLNRRIALKEFAISGSEHNPAIRERKMLTFLKQMLCGNQALIEKISTESDHFIVKDSLPELVDAMNELMGNNDVSLEHVQQEVSDFDANFERGSSQYNDDQIRRIQHAREWGPDKLRTCKPEPLSKGGPYIAIKLNLVSRKSLGGIKTDLRSRVLNHADSPIEGLYAVGECSGFGGGGSNGLRSLEGTFLAGCILTARMAARAINGENDAYFTK